MVCTKSEDSLSILASDATRQRKHRITGLDRRASIGEIVDCLAREPTLSLQSADPSGRTLTYHARLEREGRFLHDSEIAGDALQEGDEVVMQPYVTAG